MLKRKQSGISKHETDWFMFSTALHSKLCSDYLSLRLLNYVEPLTAIQTNLQLMIEIVERSLKLFIIVKNLSQTALKDAESYGHNVEKLRQACALIDPFFNDPEILSFTKDLNDNKGTISQKVRYGTERSNSGFTADLNRMLPVVDKIFLKGMMQLPNQIQRIFHNSTIKFLIEGSRLDQSKNRTLLIEALKCDNLYIDEYIRNYKIIEEEHEQELRKAGLF